MTVTPIRIPGDTGVTVRFRADRFDAAMARLGYKTEISRARAIGVTKMTLYRWRQSQNAGTPLRSTPTYAHRVAQVTGLTVDQLFPLGS